MSRVRSQDRYASSGSLKDEFRCARFDGLILNTGGWSSPVRMASRLQRGTPLLYCGIGSSNFSAMG